MDEDRVPHSELEHGLWRRGDLSYLLDDLQYKIRETIHSTTYDKICILSSRQIGKSFLGDIIAVEYCAQNPGKIVRILAPTLKQASDIVNDNLNKILMHAPQGFVERQKSEYRWNFYNGSSLRIGTIERAHVDNNRGGNASLIIYDEGGFVPSSDYIYAVDSVLGPQLLRSGGREIHLTTPSEDEFHHIHSVIRPQCEAHGTFFKYTVYDSPSLDHNQIQKAIERCGGEATETFRREYLAEIIRSSSLSVLPEYDDDLHTADFEIPEHYKACIVWDMGGIKDKTAILTCIWDWQSARLLVWDEALFDQNTPTRDIVIKSRQMEQELWGEGETPPRWADVPGQQTVDLASLFKYPVQVPPKDDRDAQINALRLAFVHGKVLIHKRCVNLRGNLKVARYNDKRTDFERHPLFGHCDPLMALVYANRVIDKKTLPLPERVINFENKIYLPHRTKSDPHLTELANAIAPYNPLKRLHKRG